MFPKDWLLAAPQMLLALAKQILPTRASEASPEKARGQHPRLLC